MDIKLAFSHYHAWVAFFQIFICGFVGVMIAWVSGMHWSIGAEYGLALGCGIYAATCSDTSPLIRDHFGRLER